MMNKYSRYSLFLMVVAVAFSIVMISCGPKKQKRIEPVEPTPPAETPAPPAPEPSPQPEPAPSPKPPEPVPQPAPRQPAKGDTASLKLVDSGVKQMNAGNLDSAEQMFEQALRVSPTNGRPYYYLGVLAGKQKDYARSMDFLQQAEIYLKDDNFWLSQVMLEEALCLKATGHAGEAKSKLQEAVRLDSTNRAAQDLLNKM